ncbi:hypothetical protein [Bradyrhizobium sp.]|uniref:hypothetical protein n=1 Tax=Bradyrhizobium sp. TaxID=376 RepID=UPI0025BA3231|nr:hypothetical protein [Bradyrhizobium sp.]
MERYVRNENIARYRKLIAISEGDPGRDETRYRTLLRLLAEEETKYGEPSDHQRLTGAPAPAYRSSSR